MRPYYLAQSNVKTLGFVIAISLCLAGFSCSDNESQAAKNTTTTTIGPNGGTARSADGQLELTFPAGAVSSDTEITILREASTALGPDFDGLEAEQTYELGPSGLMFAEPVVVRFRSAESPAGPFSTPLLLLASISNGVSELLDKLGTERNETGQVIASGELNHFSRVVILNRIVTDDGQRIVLGSHTVLRFPERAIEKENFPLTFEFQSNIGPVLPGFGNFNVQEFIFDLRGIAVDEARELTLVNSNGPVQEYELKTTNNQCLEANEFSFGFDAVISHRYEIDSVRPPSLRRLLAEKAQTSGNSIFLRISPRGNCIAPATEDPTDPTEVRIGSGLFQVRDGNTALAKLEAIQNVGPKLGNLEAAQGSTLMSMIGAQGAVVIDLVRNAVIAGSIDTDGDPERTGRFGQVAVSQPAPGPSTEAALFQFGIDPNTPFGGFLLNYDTQNQTFPSFGQVTQGRFTDASPTGGSLVSDEVLACASGSAIPIAFIASSGLYEAGQSFSVGRECVSVVAAAAGGPVLSASVTAGRFTDSRLFFSDRSGEATEIGSLGTDARRIRHKSGIAAATLFADDAIRLLQWDGNNAPTVLDPVIPVGDGPVGLDIRETTDGNLQILTSGFNDNTLSISTVDANGNLIANQKFSALSGCEQPAHPIFIDNSTDTNDPFVVTSCFGSDNYAVNKVSELVELTAGTM